jgi:hypothetical protein
MRGLKVSFTAQARLLEADEATFPKITIMGVFSASLAPEEYRTLLKSNGFRVVAHLVEDPNCGGHTIWLAQAEH